MKRTTLVSAISLALSLVIGTGFAVVAQQAAPPDLEELWIASLAEHGSSHASGGQPELGPTILGNPTRAVVLLRVGLHYSYTATGAYSEFFTRDHPYVRISNTNGAAAVLDLATRQQIAVMRPGEVFDVRYDGAAYLVSASGGMIGAFRGPVYVRPWSPDNLFRIDSIERADIIRGGRARPLYRGAIEIARGPSTAAGKVNLVNVIELESYVRGVVANESPASFHVEALKAQATAARGYAVANIGRFRPGYPFDIVDSAASQVYRGRLAEHPNAVAATEGTRGLVASYAGRIISALYSSSFGGHSENNEWIFNFPGNQFPGANAVPYLRGIYDAPGDRPDLADPATNHQFWSTPQPDTYDSCEQVRNRFARWKITIPASVLKARLPARSTVVNGNLSGAITGVEILQSMAASGRAGVVRVHLTSGMADVKGWTNIRAVFGTNASTPAPSLCPTSTTFVAAGFVLNNPSVIEPYYQAGAFAGVVSWGGGWGHNTGLSQFGGHGRGRAGQNFVQILKAYYTGVDIGSYPIDIGREPGSGPPTLRQEFVAPTGRGTLEIRPTGGLQGLRVHFNDTYDLSLTAEELAQPVVRVDVTPFLVPGANVVQYNPVGRVGGATVLIIID